MAALAVLRATTATRAPSLATAAAGAGAATAVRLARPVRWNSSPARWHAHRALPSLFRHVKEPFPVGFDTPPTEEQVQAGSERVLRHLDAVARAVDTRPTPALAPAADTPATGVITPAVRRRPSKPENPAAVPGSGSTWQVRPARPANPHLFHPTDIDATPERIERLLDELALRGSNPRPTGTMITMDLSSVLKKRKKKMNKHKYKKRLKMTRALRKSLNK